MFCVSGIKPEDFSWPSYLKLTESIAAPENAFYTPHPVGRHNFRTCMKLEAIDRKNPDLVCVSSVNNVVGDQFLIHFDEWDDQYDYWCREDCPYIHPMGWCQSNGIPLVPPTGTCCEFLVYQKIDVHSNLSRKTI